jgi:hypothetical protein
VGSGSKGKDGEIQPVSVQVGDKSSSARIFRHQSSSRWHEAAHSTDVLKSFIM